MAVIGELVIGISAKLDGLDRGLRETRTKVSSLTSQFRSTVRTVRQLTVGFGALTLAGRMVKSMSENGSVGAEKLQTSLSKLGDAGLTLADKLWGPMLEHFSQAAEGVLILAGHIEDAGAQVRKAVSAANGGDMRNTIFDPKFRSLLAGGFNSDDTKKGLEMLDQMKKHLGDLEKRGLAANGATKGMHINPKLQKDIEAAAKATADLEAKLQKAADDQKAVEDMIEDATKRRQDLQDEGNGITKADRAVFDAIDLGATSEQLMEIRRQYDEIARMEQYRADLIAEEDHRAEVLEREVAEFQKLQDWVDRVDESLKGPNEQLDEFISKIEDAKSAGLMSDFQAERAIEAERKKLFGEKEEHGPTASVFRGSQEAFSAIARFKNGNQDKIPAQQLAELRGIRRDLKRPDQQTIPELN